MHQAQGLGNCEEKTIVIIGGWDIVPEWQDILQ